MKSHPANFFVGGLWDFVLCFLFTFSVIFTFMYFLNIISWSVNLSKALMPMCISPQLDGIHFHSLASRLNWWASFYYRRFLFLTPVYVQGKAKLVKHSITTNWLILFIKPQTARRRMLVDWWDNGGENIRAFRMMSFLVFFFSLYSFC